MKYALVLTVAASLLAAPAFAGGYLSDYRGGGNQYGYGSRDPLSDYPSGAGYNPRSFSGNKGYTGPGGDIERKHRRDWETYLRNRRNVSYWSWNYPWYNPGNIRLGRPAVYQPCGNYARAPRPCTLTTTPYDPIVHGY